MFTNILRAAASDLVALSRPTVCRSVKGILPAGDLVRGRLHRPLRLPTAGLKQRRLPLCAMSGRQTFGSFDDMLSASPEPVLVDFYSNTCGPCVMMGRTLEQVAAQLKVLPCRIMKVDVDKYPNIADRFQIQALPTLILFKDNKEVRRLLGYRDGATLEREVRDALAQTSQPI
jgi:thioredoxin